MSPIISPCSAVCSYAWKRSGAIIRPPAALWPSWESSMQREWLAIQSRWRPSVLGSSVPVLRAKVQGSWVLHQLSLKEPELELFVTFSSIASLWGSRGQGSYAAANAFLDGLAHYRQHFRDSSRRLLPALDINWGPWNMGAVEPPEAQAVTSAVTMDETGQQQEDRQGAGMAGCCSTVAFPKWCGKSQCHKV